MDELDPMDPKEDTEEDELEGAGMHIEGDDEVPPVEEESEENDTM